MPTYRYDYQGAYSEKDQITGYNNFELRMYDSRIGRWLSTDPFSVGNTPYNGMGNNPISSSDKNGGVPSTDVIDNGDGTYTVVNAIPDKDRNIYLDVDGKRTATIVGQSNQPDSFLIPNDATGGYSGIAHETFPIQRNNLPNGNAIFNDYTSDWRVKSLPLMINSDAQLAELAYLSKLGGDYDIKKDFADVYTPVLFNGQITTIRELGNIIFGANLRYINRNAIDQTFVPASVFYQGTMPVVGWYNQHTDGGNGYNNGYPYYGEHSYSGSAIYFGYFGQNFHQ